MLNHIHKCECKGLFERNDTLQINPNKTYSKSLQRMSDVQSLLPSVSIIDFLLIYNISDRRS